jgi:hypothetical protein
LKTLTIPPPATGAESKNVHDVAWKLFNKEPSIGFGDVKQGALANCPIAAILAAMAYTASGRSRIQGMIKESKDTVETNVAAVAGQLDSPPKDNKITSQRYFTVSLGETFEVSDVFYTNDADKNWSLIYMRSPTEALWPCVIEKAYAAKVKSYEELDSAARTANEFWKVLVGSDPHAIEVNDDTDVSTIRKIAAVAHRVPTMGASRDDAHDVEPWHGFAVLGVQGDSIKLYNPWAERTTISIKTFRKNFKAILRAKA